MKFIIFCAFMICLIDRLGDALKHKDTFLMWIDYLFAVGWLAIIYVFLSEYKVELRNITKNSK